MVKEKKLTKSSIAIIVLALLLVASLIMGMTGAWFTASSQKTVTPISLQFGKVEYTLEANTTVANQGKQAGTATTAPYLLVAGSTITSEVTITNTSDVDSYYIIDGPSGEHLKVGAQKLEEISNDQAVKLNNGQGVAFKVRYTVKSAANSGTNRDLIFTYAIWDPTANGNEGAFGSETALTYASGDYKIFHLATAAEVEADAAENVGDRVEDETLIYGDGIDLGLRLLLGTFTLKAVQAENIADAATAFTMLTTNWATTSANGNA